MINKKSFRVGFDPTDTWSQIIDGKHQLNISKILNILKILLLLVSNFVEIIRDYPAKIVDIGILLIGFFDGQVR